ncbi:hypothetical protein [Daejeonella sp.]|uniref:hypothetical protein n=1 Tax=Daejeonella sp. TaxID=2805397 RepID=UPI0025BCE679|nr:hypothetical protein [Daejeonella sp.]
MKKILLALLISHSIISCKGQNKTENQQTSAAEKTNSATEGATFNDDSGCDKLSNLYEAIPHLGSYKDLVFWQVSCFENEDHKFLEVVYGSRNSSEDLKIKFYDISGKKPTENNAISQGKANFSTINYPKEVFHCYPSKINRFDNATINLKGIKSESNDVVYTATYKDKIMISALIRVKSIKDVNDVDNFMKEYLEKINLDKIISNP